MGFRWGVFGGGWFELGISPHQCASLDLIFSIYAVLKKCIYITRKVGSLLDKLIYRQRPYLVLSNFTFVEEWLRLGEESQMRGLRILIACFRAPGTRLTVPLSRHVMKHPSAHRLSLARRGYTLVEVYQTLQLQLLERWKWKVISQHLKMIILVRSRLGTMHEHRSRTRFQWS